MTGYEIALFGGEAISLWDYKVFRL